MFKKNTFYLLITKPNIYFKKLAIKTLFIGVITLLLNILLHLTALEKLTVPTSMHSLIGIVIGLLLVFRTNTAYDRWWDGRKTIGLISSEIGMISARLGAIETEANKIYVESLKTNLDKFLLVLKEYLVHGDDHEQSRLFHLSQKKYIESALKDLGNISVDDANINHIHGSISKLLEYSNSLERIKNTPIPLSYVLHIRVSILIYIITLPFGLFHDLGMWSTLMVMIVYYIISGVEIISNEIENPFGGDPNDLPVQKLFASISDTLWDKGK